MSYLLSEDRALLVELGERVIFGLYKENKGPPVECIGTIMFRGWTGKMHARGLSLKRVAFPDGVHAFAVTTVVPVSRLFRREEVIAASL